MGKSAEGGNHFYDTIILPLYQFIHPSVVNPIRPNARFGRQTYYLSILREGWSIVRDDILTKITEKNMR